MNSIDFRKELEKIMPGYTWKINQYLEATGTQCSGSNRLSTLSVTKREQDGEIRYTVKSAGYGLHSPWLHRNEDVTLVRALRGLQDHYEWMAANYGKHAEAMRRGRRAA